MVELVDTQLLNSCSIRSAGSIPARTTMRVITQMVLSIHKDNDILLGVDKSGFWNSV